ncbi:MAG: EAL domain-containing protein [Epulopiscium sp.]|nr:EAL domain-containing protein [Candidatus Epulonipiscium sp.]
MHNNLEQRDNLNEVKHCSNQLKILMNAFNTLEIAICIMDREGLFVYVNDAYCRIYGYEKDEFLGQSFHLIIPPDEREKYWHEHNSFMMEESVYSGERMIEQKNGKNINVSVTVTKIQDEMNNYYQVVTLTDITEKIQAELDVKKFMMAVGQTVDWVVITNKHGVIEYANDSVARITGYSIEEIIGKTPSIWKSYKYNRDFYKNIWDTILSGKPYQNVIINRKKNGELFHLNQSISPLKSEDGEILYFVSTGKDITENVVLEDKLYYLSHYDMITGLPNRTEFSRRITQAITNAELDTRKVAVLIMDINKFIFINETFGTEIGDMVLRNIGNQLSKAVGKKNVVARIGGDEFGIILKDIKSSEDIFVYIDKIYKLIQQPVRVGEQEIVLSMSMGISIYPNDGKDMKQLISKTEIALSQARRSETNKYMFYGEHMNSDAKNFLLMENKLLKAIKNEEFIVFYQPYFNLRTHELEGIEALVRWEDKESGIISPGIFIPILEETGLIKEVGRQIIKIVCRQLRQWLDQGYEVVPVAINLSPVQFRSSTLLKDIMEAVEEYELNPNLIVFEITESTFMQDIAATYEVLREMKNAGFTISIDDFGTGYSSLSYLKKFPVDHLKIDLSFIRDITKDTDDKAIVNAIISMAHHLNLKTIAEGIEEEEQLRELFYLQCDIGQGYYWSRPVPAHKVESFLKYDLRNNTGIEHL